MNNPMMHNQVWMLTGAAGGLGSALAHCCAEAGATLVLVDKNASGLEAVADGLVSDGLAEPVLLPMDLQGITPADLDSVVGQLESQLGRLDGLVHCAAHVSGLSPHDHLAPDDWLRTLQVNLNAPWLLTRSLLPLLAAQPGGRIVFCLDRLERMQKAFWGAYGVSKQALMSLVSQLREELEPSQVRVFGFNPGPMETALRHRLYMADAGQTAPPPEKAARRLFTVLSSVQNPAAFIDLEPS